MPQIYNIMVNHITDDIIKVAYLIKFMDGGGVERLVSTLSTNIDSSIIDFQIVTTVELPSPYPTNKPPISLDIDISRGNKIDFIQVIRTVIAYRRYLITNNISVSFDQGGILGLINILASMGTCVKTVTSAHGVSNYKKPNTIKEKILKLIKLLFTRIILNKSDAFISVSKRLTKSLIEEGVSERKLIEIYNPFDIAKIVTMSEESLDDPFFQTNLPILIHVGRLAPVKCQINLLRIVRELIKDKPCKLAILGDGELYEELNQIISDFDISEFVKIYGFVDNPFKYVSHSTLYLHSSLTESFSNVLIEALAVSCPIITTDCPVGPREILCNGKYGVLTPPFTQHALSDYTASLSLEEIMYLNEIKSLLSDEKRRRIFSSQGPVRAMDFDIKPSIAAYTNLILRLAER